MSHTEHSVCQAYCVYPFCTCGTEELMRLANYEVTMTLTIMAFPGSLFCSGPLSHILPSFLEALSPAFAL